MLLLFESEVTEWTGMRSGDFGLEQGDKGNCFGEDDVDFEVVRLGMDFPRIQDCDIEELIEEDTDGA